MIMSQGTTLPLYQTYFDVRLRNYPVLRHNFDNARHWPTSRRGLAIGLAKVNAAVITERSYFSKRPGDRLSRSHVV